MGKKCVYSEFPTTGLFLFYHTYWTQTIKVLVSFESDTIVNQSIGCQKILFSLRRWTRARDLNITIDRCAAMWQMLCFQISVQLYLSKSRVIYQTRVCTRSGDDQAWSEQSGGLLECVVCDKSCFFLESKGDRMQRIMSTFLISWVPQRLCLVCAYEQRAFKLKEFVFRVCNVSTCVVHVLLISG